MQEADDTSFDVEGDGTEELVMNERDLTTLSAVPSSVRAMSLNVRVKRCCAAHCHAYSRTMHVHKLQRNRLSSLEDVDLSAALVSLSVAHNNIHSLDALAAATHLSRSLQTLCLDENHLTDESIAVRPCAPHPHPHLCWLIALPAQVLRCLPALRHLSAAANMIRRVDCVADMPSLTYLDLSNNQIHKLVRAQRCCLLLAARVLTSGRAVAGGHGAAHAAAHAAAVPQLRLRSQSSGLFI